MFPPLTHIMWNDTVAESVEMHSVKQAIEGLSQSTSFSVGNQSQKELK